MQRPEAARRADLPVLIAAVLVFGPAIQAQTSSATASVKPRFEVASIKACRDEGGPGGGGRKGAGSDRQSSSPGRLQLPCFPVRFFVQLAYIFSDPTPHGEASNLRLEGGPGWIDSERYQIDAKPEGLVSKEIMNGPMLQSLLEERFHLKVHRETREVPLYALSVAKGGLKLAPSDPGSCTPRDPGQASLPPPAPGQKPWCGQVRSRRNPHQITIDLPSGTLAQLSQSLLGGLDRPVIDRTGVSRTFDFHLEFAPEGTDVADDTGPPSIFAALGKLGLRLESVKGPREFLVIDHVERPTEN